MEFIETPTFIKSAGSLLTEDALVDLQSVLMLRPEAGARVIYYWLRADHQIYLLLAYAKNRQENLTPEQARLLRHIIEDL